MRWSKSEEIIPSLLEKYDAIDNTGILIMPGDYDRWTNTIMDIILSRQRFGAWEGITHTITGVYVMLTGVDTRQANSRVWI